MGLSVPRSGGPQGEIDFAFGSQVIGAARTTDGCDWPKITILSSLYSVVKGKVIHLTRLISLLYDSLTVELFANERAISPGTWPGVFSYSETCRIVKSFSIFALIMVLSHSALLHERLFNLINIIQKGETKRF